MDTISDLRVFAAVAENGGLSAAGRRLGLSPPAVSHRINRIEDRLGVRLLQRTTRQVTLTEEGREYHERAVKILADIDELEAVVGMRSPVVRGMLRVSAPSGFAARHVTPHLPEFLAQYPDLQIEIDATDRFVDIIETGHDLAIWIGRAPDSSLIAAKLADNRRVLVASPSYLARRGTPRRPEDLEGHTLLALPWQQEWRLRTPAGETSVRARGPLRLNGGDMLREGALAGLGIALMSLWDVGQLIQAGRLRPVLDGLLLDTDAPIHALYPSRNHVPPRVRAFISFLRKTYGDVPCWSTPECRAALGLAA